MKIILPEVDFVFDCGLDACCSVVVENQDLLYRAVKDISLQIDGWEGKSVLSDENKILQFSKSGEIISQFVPFDMNRKRLISKISARMQQTAVTDLYHMETNEFLAEWERYMMGLSGNLTGNIEFSKISVDSLIKASGIHIEDVYDNLGEQLLDYFELVHEYDAKKLFVLVNLRSYMTDDDMNMFLEDVIARQIQILLLESGERNLLNFEKRYIVDKDLCVLC